MDDTAAHNPQFALQFGATAAVSPTERVTFTHLVRNSGNTQVSVNLSVASTLGGALQLYGETDPPTPISQPVQLAAIGGQFEFRVAGNILAGAEGAHVLYITATNAANAAQKTQVTDLPWVGKWEPPPPFKVYLPVVMSR